MIIERLAIASENEWTSGRSKLLVALLSQSMLEGGQGANTTENVLWKTTKNTLDFICRYLEFSTIFFNDYSLSNRKSGLAYICCLIKKIFIFIAFCTSIIHSMYVRVSSYSS